MASANLDLVRSIYAAAERGDFFSSVEWADPELELVFTEGPQRGSWKGLAAVGEAWSDFLRSGATSPTLPFRPQREPVSPGGTASSVAFGGGWLTRPPGGD